MMMTSKAMKLATSAQTTTSGSMVLSAAQRKEVAEMMEAIDEGFFGELESILGQMAFIGSDPQVTLYLVWEASGKNMDK